ncbi:ATP-dependent DNA helicase [Paraferrimonas haliotis]|uniref:DEAD/DEAH box helicase n=1 Tax=Paraferrimonas haliotis TaxID=2013866 RepID=A0AA37TN50_9GAMM|nr:ATP-dependent DNA helicase [Paraferrimonas haliotis]GLS84749.1 DEAD/DEAH box helicase [Paraferrimonas haliotis]
MSLEKLFDQESQLAHVLPGYQPRKSQVECSIAIDKAFSDATALLVEAPTGIGKSLAYLLAGLHKGERLLVSTATKSLQEQLALKDIAIAARALKRPISHVVLKGRRNYICPLKLSDALQDYSSFDDVTQSRLLQLEHWQANDDTQDLDNFTLDLTDQQRRQVTIQSAECLSEYCPKFSQCRYQKQRLAAIDCDVVVVNHHWLLSELTMANDQDWIRFTERNVVLDEAHWLPKVGLQILTRGWWFNAILQWPLLVNAQSPQAFEIKQAILNLAQQLQHWLTDITDIETDINPNIDRGERLLAALNNNPVWLGQLNRLQQDITALQLNDPKLVLLGTQLTQACEVLSGCLHLPTEQVQIEFVGGYPQIRLLQSTEKSWQALWNKLPKGKALISSSLAIEEDMNWFARLIGVTPQKKLRLSQTFDYQRQAQLLIPNDAPHPNADFNQRAHYLAMLISKLADAGQGRCLCLFTNLELMQQVALMLSQSTQLKVLVQGQYPQGSLIQRFRLLGNSVLLASKSFWQGVDMPSGSVVCTLIDRIPFMSPQSKSAVAMQHAMALSQQQTFNQLTLPMGILELKQGVGRLIRRENQRGLLVICDPRLQTEAYGTKMLASLPQMKRCSSIEAALDYLREL